MAPISSKNFSCNKIAVDYTTKDGRTESMETVVMERERAAAIYEDKIASGQSAMIATLPPQKSLYSAGFIRISLGNIPAHC